MRAAGSMRWPPLISRLVLDFSGLHRIFPIARARIAMRVGTPLCTSSRMRACATVGDFAGQFQPANDRPGMHHDGIFLRHLQPCRIHLVARNILRQIDLQPGQPLLLHAQQHDHIGPAQRVFNVARHAHAGSKRDRNVGHQFRRAAQNNLHAKFAEQMARRARHAAVKNVADNRDLQPFESFFVAQNRVSIEQRLRGMFVQSISGIDDRHIDVLRHHVRRARVGMPNDDDIGADRAHRVSRIEQRFALLNARTDGLDENGVRAQRFGGDLKRTSGARRSLVEKKQHPLALEQGTRLVRIHAPGKLQNSQDLGRFQMLNTEQGTARCIHNRLNCRLLFFHQQNFLRVIHFAKFHLDNLIFRGLHRPPNESSLDRQLAMPAIDQYAQLQALRTARPKQGVHGGARGAPGIKHVVDQHHRLAFDREFPARFSARRAWNRAWKDRRDTK